MRKLALSLFVFFPLTAVGQYIGHPAGKTEPLGVTRPDVLYVRGMGGVEGGYMDLGVNTRYNVEGGAFREKSTLKDTYFALYASGHAMGAELEAKIGGSLAQLKESSFANDPHEDAYGILVGGSARWGFAVVTPVRFGLGGQVLYSRTDGDSAVPLTAGGSTQTGTELELWRGDVFAGIGVDFPMANRFTVSPYLGAGLQLIDGKLTIDKWQSTFLYLEDMGQVKQDHLEFFFGGVDIFVTDQVRIGVEGRGNTDGWGAFFNLGWRF